MAVKLFILGLPGSGKSTISRYIIDYVQQRHKDWLPIRINDYDILHTMFLADTQGRFGRTEHGGFDIYDLSVFDMALREMEQKASELTHTAKKKELIMIEFARNDYIQAFRQFSFDFLQNAYFLFLDADMDTCKQRIHDRVDNPVTEDDYFVSDYILETYYSKDNHEHLSASFKAAYRIDAQRIKVIDNKGGYEDILEKINQFIDFIFEQEGGDLLTTN
jgi:thymidylate kinase